MTTELWMLIASLGVLVGLTMMQSIGNIKTYGILRVVGPRDDFPAAPPAFLGRLQRALLNLLEALALFTPVVLIATVAGVSNALTVTGAVLFFVSRVVHVIVYVSGLPWARSFAFMGGFMGTAMIVYALAVS